MSNRREFLGLLAASGAGFMLSKTGLGYAVSGDAWSTEYPNILTRIKPPSFPKRDFDITKFGAKAGATNDSSAAFATETAPHRSIVNSSCALTPCSPAVVAASSRTPRERRD